MAVYANVDCDGTVAVITSNYDVSTAKGRIDDFVSYAIKIRWIRYFFVLSLPIAWLPDTFYKADYLFIKILKGSKTRFSTFLRGHLFSPEDFYLYRVFFFTIVTRQSNILVVGGIKGNHHIYTQRHM